MGRGLGGGLVGEMNRQQRATVTGLAVAAVLVGVVMLVLLAVEGHAVVVHGHSTISELIWVVWGTQPWVILLGSHMVAAPVWFLAGHFFAQSREVYARIREKGL
jgi:hypothetical protein